MKLSNETMTREEAIEVYNGLINKKIKEAFEFFAPELRENGDERIRKALVEGVRQIRCKNGITQEQMLAYLEKQRDFQSKVQRRMEHLWDKLPDSDKVENGDCTPEEWKALGAYMELEMNFDNGSEEKQKEQKPVDDKAFEEWIDDWWKHNKVNNPASYDKGDEIQFDERGFKNFCRGIRNMYQQKPADLPPGFYFIDLDGKKYYSKEFRFGDMKMKIVEDKSEKPAERSETKINGEPISAENQSVDIPLVEWSEEDERMLTDISWAIRHCAYDDKKKERVMKWFNDDYRKFLRPS